MGLALAKGCDACCCVSVADDFNRVTTNGAGDPWVMVSDSDPSRIFCDGDFLNLDDAAVQLLYNKSLRKSSMQVEANFRLDPSYSGSGASADLFLAMSADGSQYLQVHVDNIDSGHARTIAVYDSSGATLGFCVGDCSFGARCLALDGWFTVRACYSKKYKLLVVTVLDTGIFQVHPIADIPDSRSYAGVGGGSQVQVDGFNAFTVGDPCPECPPSDGSDPTTHLLGCDPYDPCNTFTSFGGGAPNWDWQYIGGGPYLPTRPLNFSGLSVDVDFEGADNGINNCGTDDPSWVTGSATRVVVVTGTTTATIGISISAAGCNGARIDASITRLCLAYWVNPDDDPGDVALTVEAATDCVD